MTSRKESSSNKKGALDPLAIPLAGQPPLDTVDSSNNASARSPSPVSAVSDVPFDHDQAPPRVNAFRLRPGASARTWLPLRAQQPQTQSGQDGDIPTANPWDEVSTPGASNQSAQPTISTDSPASKPTDAARPGRAAGPQRQQTSDKVFVSIRPGDHSGDEKGGQTSHKASKKSMPLPPTGDIVDPFGSLTLSRDEGPTTEPYKGPTASENAAKEQHDLAKRPTCSLNLVCYSRGCTMSQVQVTTRARWESKEVFERMVKNHGGLLVTDQQLFEALREKYLEEMCGFWRRYFSLKTLRRLRLLSYTEFMRPTAVPLDEFTMAEVLYAYNHASEFGTETDWIEWVFRLRQPNKRHALEFVEGWNGTRIAIVGSIPCVASTLVGVIWSGMGGDIQTAFTVAGFILTVATVLLALLAVISGIDSKAH